MDPRTRGWMGPEKVFDLCGGQFNYWRVTIQMVFKALFVYPEIRVLCEKNVFCP